MKNKDRKLKRTILLRTSIITLLAALTGYGVVSFLVDGIWKDSMENLFTGIACRFGIDSQLALNGYEYLFVRHRIWFITGAAMILFAVLLYHELGRMTESFRSVNQAVEGILKGEEEPVVLPSELAPVARNLSELQKLLQRRKLQEAESERKRNEQVVYLAHDLKTPLTSVLAYLTMLDEQPDMPRSERVKYTQITMEKAYRLEELIKEFFDITRFNLQDMVLEKEELNLSIFLEQLADESYGLLSEKGMTAAVDVQENLMITGDPDKLARVFDNLLRNAVAYGYENSEILIQARGGHGRITIVFTNESPQIPQKKLDLIFEKFYRVDDARSSKTGGAGLGLAIAKRIVELHGGMISAASDSKNTRFIVSLPSEEKPKRHKGGIQR